MTVTTEARNVDLPALSELLTGLQAVKLDAVVPATAIRAKGGLLHIEGMSGRVSADTVEELLSGTASSERGVFRPSAVMDAQIAERLGIPTAYLRRMRADRVDLYDANVNGWLHGRTVRRASGDVETLAEPDSRRFLIRTFLDGGIGYGRACLSDGYGGAVDHLDPLIAALDAVREVDPAAEVVRCNLSERRMVVHIASPSVAVAAPELLKGYRSPIRRSWTPKTGPQVGDVVFAGFILSNSETGHGAFTIVPSLTVLACTNGMTVTKDAYRKVHLGVRQDEGVVSWSDETRRNYVELIRSSTRDTVRHFLSTDYVSAALDAITEKATVELSDPARTIDLVSKQLSFSDDVRAMVLDHFIRGAQTTAGGVMQAVTSTAQMVPSPDVAFDLEASAMKALDLASAG